MKVVIHFVNKQQLALEFDDALQYKIFLADIDCDKQFVKVGKLRIQKYNILYVETK